MDEGRIHAHPAGVKPQGELCQHRARDALHGEIRRPTGEVHGVDRRALGVGVGLGRPIAAVDPQRLADADPPHPGLHPEQQVDQLHVHAGHPVGAHIAQQVAEQGIAVRNQGVIPEVEHRALFPGLHPMEPQRPLREGRGRPRRISVA